MKKSLSCRTAVIMGTFLMAGHSFAGVKSVSSGVAAESTYMFGCLGDARNSANTTESLGFTDTGSTIYFSARNTAAVTKLCATTNELHKTQFRSANSDACFWVDYNSSGACTSVKVYNDSQRQPKVK